MSLLAAGYSLSDADWQLLTKILFDESTGKVTADGGFESSSGNLTLTSGDADIGGSLDVLSIAMKAGSSRDIGWTTDGGGVVGTSSSTGRPDYVHAKTGMTVGGSTVATTGSSVGGDISGTIASANVDKIRGYTVQNHAPLTGEALVYSGSQYEPTAVATGTIGLRPLDGSANITIEDGEVETVLASYTYANSEFDGATIIYMVAQMEQTSFQQSDLDLRFYRGSTQIFSDSLGNEDYHFYAVYVYQGPADTSLAYYVVINMLGGFNSDGNYDISTGWIEATETLELRVFNHGYGSTYEYKGSGKMYEMVRV